jgi:hypothetical protein
METGSVITLKVLLQQSWGSTDKDVWEAIQAYASGLSAKPYQRDLQDGQMFWPPRVVQAVQGRRMVPFFGAGMSLAAGVPGWGALLMQLGVDPELEKDPHIRGDMLTLAELAAHARGSETLQNAMRQALPGKEAKPTAGHLLLACLNQPIYITSNYDTLFENALAIVDGGGRAPDDLVERITTDADVYRVLGADSNIWDEILFSLPKVTVIKIHGCITKANEHLILTRSDYRRHYRNNPQMLKLLCKVMSTRQTVFLGFSHSDPGIARLVDDVVHTYEDSTDGHSVEADCPTPTPGIYSVQFDMLQSTPEIFAARGIVALPPPLPQIRSGDKTDPRSRALGQGLIDLIASTESRFSGEISLDCALASACGFLEMRLKHALDVLGQHSEACIQTVRRKDRARLDAGKQILDKIQSQPSLADFANQGVYLVDARGELIALAVPAGLDGEAREQVARREVQTFAARPYFREANSLRKPFVSNSFESLYNGNSTVALCLPLTGRDRREFNGLLFSVFQLRDDGFAAEIRSKAATTTGTLLVVDANGLLLLPPEGEYKAAAPSWVKCPNEEGVLFVNDGFRYEDLKNLSRRDKRVDRISQNVVPLGQDDDIHRIASDVTLYSVVTQLEKARWKVALSQAILTKSLAGQKARAAGASSSE